MKRTKAKQYSRKHKHKHTVHHRNKKRRYNHNHSVHHRNNKTRKQKEISVIMVPGSKSIPMFSRTYTNKKKMEPIRLENESMGNIIPGLRNYLKNM